MYRCQWSYESSFKISIMINMCWNSSSVNFRLSHLLRLAFTNIVIFVSFFFWKFGCCIFLVILYLCLFYFTSARPLFWLNFCNEWKKRKSIHSFSCTTQVTFYRVVTSIWFFVIFRLSVCQPEPVSGRCWVRFSAQTK